MREISPAENRSVDEYLRALPEKQEAADRIRRRKAEGSLPGPSATLIDLSTLLSKGHRKKVLDKVAGLVDENLFGRSEMCIQFADLLQRALDHLGLPARWVGGWAIYFRRNEEIFRWQHAWVRVGVEVIDGNVDCLSENPSVPTDVKLASYWGPIADVPGDRRLREDRGYQLPLDRDVRDIWWPDLREWLRLNEIDHRRDNPDAL